MELLCEEDPAAYDWHPEKKADGSEIGINFLDAYIKPLNKAKYQGFDIKAKRRGLKLTIQLGDQKAEAIMRGEENGHDAEEITHAALTQAFQGLNKQIVFKDQKIYLA